MVRIWRKGNPHEHACSLGMLTGAAAKNESRTTIRSSNPASGSLPKKIKTVIQQYMHPYIQFSSVQSLSHVWIFATPWIAARQASLSIINSRSSPKLMCIELVMPSSHLILCRPLLLLPPVPPSIRVFSNESTLRMRWPKYWVFSLSISPSNEHPRLVSLGWIGWISLCPRHSQESSPTPQFKSINSSVLSFLHSPTHIHTWPLEKS